MKITLTFDTNEDGTDAGIVAQRGWQYRSALMELDEEARSRTKYKNTTVITNEDLRVRIRELLADIETLE